MEVSKNEVMHVELVQQNVEKLSVLELNDLQLALVGGGIGETAI